MKKKHETKIVDNLGDTDEVVPAKYEITSYGADFLVDGLVERLRNDDIFIPAFQRGFVWTHKQASRFIESLLLGLPVPGVFFSKDNITQKLLVIDGQQRLRTLHYFFDGVFADTGKVFALKGVQQKFENITFKKLSDEDRRRLENAIIHSTIVQQDRPPLDDSSIYYIFERLNTGGTVLSAQEIRMSIYNGKFSDLLRQCNKNEAWRAVYGPINSRMRDLELILRFFALHFDKEKYQKPMREFLNEYMNRNRHLKLQSETELTRVFDDTIKIINGVIGDKAFRLTRALNAAVFDSVMVGVASRLEQGAIKDLERVKEAYKALLNQIEFINLCETSTADEKNVRQRIQIATKAFHNA